MHKENECLYMWADMNRKFFGCSGCYRKFILDSFLSMPKVEIVKGKFVKGSFELLPEGRFCQERLDHQVIETFFGG